jgi:hypothetical protein
LLGRHYLARLPDFPRNSCPEVTSLSVLVLVSYRGSSFCRYEKKVKFTIRIFAIQPSGSKYRMSTQVGMRRIEAMLHPVTPRMALVCFAGFEIFVVV